MSLLTTWISSRYLTNGFIEGLREAFANGAPYPHLVLEEFLLPERAELLLKALQKEEFMHKDSDLFSLSQTHDFSDSKSELVKSFYLFARSKEFCDFMRKLTGLALTPSALDLAGSLYESGDYLLCHDDQVEDRKIAYILYLSKEFSEKDGARFVLFNNARGKPTTVAKQYVPVWNSLMLFAVSPLSFHMVEENCSSKDRYAIGGWLH